jgi:hypothetical protein
MQESNVGPDHQQTENLLMLQENNRIKKFINQEWRMKYDKVPKK